MNTKSVSIIIFFLTACIIASAQQEKRDKVIRFNASHAKYGTADGYAFLNLKAGYFFSKNIEAGIEPWMMVSSGFSQLSLGVYGAYNFTLPDARMVPYAGLRLSTAFRSIRVPDYAAGSANKLNKGSANVGFCGGLRFFVTERVCFDAGAAYDFGAINVFQSTIGIGVILGRK